MSRPSIDVAERRRRLVERLHVGSPASSIDEAVADLVVLHATDAPAVFLQLWARVPEIALEDVEAALYDRRELVRVLSMRRTLFAARVADAGLVSAAAAPKILGAERRRLHKSLAANGLDDSVDLDAIARLAVTALRDHPSGLSTSEFKQAVPELDLTFEFQPGSKWSRPVSLASRLLWQLACEGRIVRGRPLGSWLGTQYRWVLPEAWHADLVLGADALEASRWLVTRWLERFGPGTFTDLQWWTGWTKTKLREVIAALDVVEVDLPGSGVDEPGLVLSGDLGPTDDPGVARVALLPMLDAVPMGWKRRSWYVQDDLVDELWDRMGNVGTTAWVNGRIVGGWTESEGRIEVQVLVDLDPGARTALRTRADDLERWLAGRSFSAYFPSPLQRRASGG